MNNLNFLKFIKFCLVGFSGLIIDFATTYLLKEKVKIPKYIANASGFILAASSNYVLNRIWTFHSKNSNIINEYSSFILISIIGLGINTLVLWIFNDKLKKNFYFSKIIAVFTATFWNFLANSFFTFN